MGLEAFKAKLDAFQSVALDTAVFIYHFENNPVYVPLTREVFRRVEGGYLAAFTSTLTITEVLTGPKKAGDKGMVLEYQRLFHIFPNLRFLPVDEEMATIAADLRAAFDIRTPDAIQLAAARQVGTQAFITNDERLKRVSGIEVLVLGQYAAPSNG
ncbi:MAG: type II toxin-antitoxin system VapC family toxin [Anaerolineae bacterium]